MTVSADGLRERILAFQIGDEGDALSFGDRLARENGWSRSYARRCIDEYRRFVYLMAISEQPVTPSDEVDQVWHLHLTYTRSYWQELCERTIGKALHHNPTRGGAAEGAKYRRQYRETLALYERTFGAPPPPEIWPPEEKRFRAVDHFVRINRADVWVVPKPSDALAAVLILPFFLVACTQEDASDAWFYFKLAVAGYILYRVFSWLDTKGRGGGGGSACGGCSGCGGCGGCGG
ncbi:hypothetical protein QQM79_14960 [Marinobacteraceae bacterium S3BR75-40.1]